MKKYLLAAVLASLCAACDEAPKNPPVSETKDTTIVNPTAEPMPMTPAPKEMAKEPEPVVTPAPVEKTEPALTTTPAPVPELAPAPAPAPGEAAPAAPAPAEPAAPPAN